MSDFATTPGPATIDPAAPTSSGAPNEPVVEPVVEQTADTDQPTGTLADLVDIADEFPGDPMAAAMEAIFKQRGIDPLEGQAQEPPAADPTDPGPEGARVANQPAPDPAPVGADADQGATGAGEGAVTPPPATPPPPAAPPAPTADSIQTWRFGDQQFTADQVQHALELAAWNETLAPEQVVAINEYLAGRATLAPAAGPTSGGVGSPAGAGTPSAPAGTPSSPSAAPDYDPEDPLQVQMAQLRSTVEQTAAQQQAWLAQQQAQQQAQIAASHREQVIAGANAAKATFATTYALDDAAVEELANVAARMQIIPGLQQKHGGDVAATMAEALEVALWSTPTYRDAWVASQAQVQTDASLSSAADLDERRRKAASIGGRGAPPPRTAPAPAAMTPDQRRAAMVAEVAGHIDRG